MAESRRKSENIRRANRVIQTRTFVLMLVLGVAMFLVLALKLYQLQIKQHDYYQSKALDQQTRSTVVTASRGTIYDRNGNELAVSATAETVFLSPKELAEELEKPETKWTKESLSAGLSQLLGVTQESILEQMERTYSQYEVVKLRVDEDTANAIITHLSDLKLITLNEAALMRAAVSRSALALPVSAKDVLRAAVLKNMLIQVFRNIEGGDVK